MSTTTEAIDLVDNLVKAKIPKETAKQLVDYADKQRDKSVDRLWLAMAILTAVVLGGFAWLRSDMQKLETGINENRKLLIQLIQKKMSARTEALELLKLLKPKPDKARIRRINESKASISKPTCDRSIM